MKIILLHSKTHFKEYLKIDKDLFNNNNIKIYAFTMQIRYFLKDRNIKYFIQEKFLSDEISEKLDDLASKIDYEWHRDLFKFMDISLGTIIQRGFYFSMCKILRSIVIILNIIKNEKPSEIVAFVDGNPHLTQFNNVLEYLCIIKKVPLKMIKIKMKKQLSEKTNPRSPNLTMRKETFLEVIGNSQIFIYFLKSLLIIIWTLKNIKIKIFKKKSKNILLYKYDYHETLAQELSKIYNLILLDDRPDVLRNKDILRIFRDKYCDNQTFYDFFATKKINKYTNLIFNSLIKKWKKNIQDPSLYNRFFYDDISIWPLIEKKMYDNLFPRFKGIIKNILISYSILKKKKYDLIIFEADTREREKIMTIIALRLGIPTLIIQHGTMGQLAGILPSYATKIAVWGEIRRNSLIQLGMNEKKLEITGSPNFDNHVNINNNKKRKTMIKNSVYKDFLINRNKKLILLVTTHNNFYKRCNSKDMNHYQVEKMYEMVFKAIRYLPNSHLIIKLRKTDIDQEIPFKIKQSLGVKNASIISDYNTLNLIVACDCFISGYSTTIIEAMLVQKPIIIINFRKSTEVLPLDKYQIIYRVSNYEQLIEKIKDSLANSISSIKYRDFLIDFIYKSDGKATKRVIKLVNNLISSQL